MLKKNPPVWPFQPELNNEVFVDDGQEGAGPPRRASPRSPVSPDRREYMSLAAVPRFSRPSWELQVPTAPPAAPLSVPVCSA